MKKILALVLALMMVFALVACGTNDTPSKDTDDTSVDASSITQGTDDEVTLRILKTLPLRKKKPLTLVNLK